jgi:hypothetical protein
MKGGIGLKNISGERLEGTAPKVYQPLQPEIIS